MDDEKLTGPQRSAMTTVRKLAASAAEPADVGYLFDLKTELDDLINEAILLVRKEYSLAEIAEYAPMTREAIHYRAQKARFAKMRRAEK
jgi:hypothetical protein